MGQQTHQRVHGSAVPQITHEGDGGAVESTNLLSDGVHVEKSLGGVLDGSIATVDDGDRRESAGDVGRLGVGVSQSDGVRVASNRSESVLQGLALLVGGGVDVDGNDTASKSLHGGIKGSGGSGGRLVEEGGQQTTLEDVQNTDSLDSLSQLVGQSKNVVQVLLGELVDRENVLTKEGVSSQLVENGRSGNLGGWHRQQTTQRGC